MWRGRVALLRWWFLVKYLFTWESDVKRQCSYIYWSEAMEGGGVLHVFLSCTALYKNVLSSVVDILLFCYCGSCLLLCTTLSPIWRSPSCALCFSTKERHVCTLSVSWSLTRCVCAWYMFSLRFSFFYCLFVCLFLFVLEFLWNPLLCANASEIFVFSL